MRHVWLPAEEMSGLETCNQVGVPDHRLLQDAYRCLLYPSRHWTASCPEGVQNTPCLLGVYEASPAVLEHHEHHCPEKQNYCIWNTNHFVVMLNALWSPVVIICITGFNIQKFYILLMEYINKFCMNLRRDTDYFPTQNQLADFKNQAVCARLLHSRNGTFKHNKDSSC